MFEPGRFFVPNQSPVRVLFFLVDYSSNAISIQAIRCSKTYCYSKSIQKLSDIRFESNYSIRIRFKVKINYLHTPSRKVYLICVPQNIIQNIFKNWIETQKL